MFNPIYLLYLVITLCIGAVGWGLYTTYADTTTGLSGCLRLESRERDRCIDEHSVKLVQQVKVIKVLTAPQPDVKSEGEEAERGHGH